MLVVDLGCAIGWEWELISVKLTIHTLVYLSRFIITVHNAMRINVPKIVAQRIDSKVSNASFIIRIVLEIC